MASPSYPKPDSFLSADEKTLGEMLLVHERQFLVPLNQRPWAWKDAGDVQSLLNDFDNILTSFFESTSSPKWKRRGSVGRPPHFFGTFVFFKKNNREFEIFDGQQRITAVSMLCAALREVANELKNLPGPHQVSASNLYGGFNEWLRISPSSSIPRLLPNTFFVKLFNALIFEPVDNSERQVALEKLPQEVLEHATTKKLKNSFEHIRAWVRQNTDALTPTDRTNFLSASHDTLRYLFSCIETRYDHKVCK